MTATRQVTIWCDGKMPDGYSCGAWFMSEAGERAAADVRRRLGEPGAGQWLVGLPHGRDLCPDHHDQRHASTSWGDGS